MKTLSIQEFAQAGGFVQIAKNVRTNVNGYPFLTFITKDNVAENIYFSKAMSKKISGDETVDKELITRLGLVIVEATNAEGEIRMKLSGNSERVSIADLFA